MRDTENPRFAPLTDREAIQIHPGAARRGIREGCMDALPRQRDLSCGRPSVKPTEPKCSMLLPGTAELILPSRSTNDSTLICLSCW